MVADSSSLSLITICPSLKSDSLFLYKKAKGNYSNAQEFIYIILSWPQFYLFIYEIIQCQVYGRLLIIDKLIVHVNLQRRPFQYISPGWCMYLKGMVKLNHKFTFSFVLFFIKQLRSGLLVEFNMSWCVCLVLG